MARRAESKPKLCQRTLKAIARANPESKICVDCLRVKPLGDFGKNPRMAQGRKSYCRKCSNKRQLEWNRKHRPVS